MGISVILVVLFYFGGVVPGTEGPNPEPKITDVILKYAYVLVIIAALFAILFPLIQLFLHPQNLKKVLITIGAVAVIVLVSRSLASDEILTLTGYTGSDNVPSVLKNVGNGLITMYILLGLAILSILYSEIAKFFK
jgi:hypothetical protein